MPKLTAGVVVRHPDSGDVEFLPEGSALPEWADGLVGSHVLAVEAGSDSGNGADVDYRNLTNAELSQLIEDRNAGRDETEKVVAAGTKKDELIAALVADDAR